MQPVTLLTLIAAALFSGLIALALTPPIRALAKHVGAVDVPRDSRRMHTTPIPRMGGLALFLGFLLASLLFADISQTLLAVWLGGLVIVLMGILDDIFRLHPIIKFLIQICAALIVTRQGLTIPHIAVWKYYIVFDEWAVLPVTVLWIVALTNAMNLIDGLDGLSTGIAAITSLSLTAVMYLSGDGASALLCALLFGACMGFLPFNKYPARIFLGDTGSQFLGFMLSVLTLSGLFKVHTVISFFVPIAIFALPLFDTTFAFFRRLFKGKNPFKGDRGHLHHRLMDLGYTQSETVAVLHAICGILGLAAVMYSLSRLRAALYVAAVGALILLLYLCLLHPTKAERAKIKQAESAHDAASEAEEAPDPLPPASIPHADGLEADMPDGKPSTAEPTATELPPLSAAPAVEPTDESNFIPMPNITASEIESDAVETEAGTSVSEAGTLVSEAGTSVSEACTSVSEACTSVSEACTSVSEVLEVPAETDFADIDALPVLDMSSPLPHPPAPPVLEESEESKPIEPHDMRGDPYIPLAAEGEGYLDSTSGAPRRRHPRPMRRPTQKNPD